MDPAKARDEAQYREIERALLFADEAARKTEKTAKQLRKEGAHGDLVTALEAGSKAIRAEHLQMMRRVYWRAPGAENNVYEGPEPGLREASALDEIARCYTLDEDGNQRTEWPSAADLAEQIASILKATGRDVS